MTAFYVFPINVRISNTHPNLNRLSTLPPQLSNISLKHNAVELFTAGSNPDKEKKLTTYKL
jgi:hypothetical protein